MRWIHEVVLDTFHLESKIAQDLKAVAEQQKEQEREQQVFSADMVMKTVLNKDQQAPQKRQKGSGACSLKTLSMSRLGRDIQAKEKKGHDSLEDALAARDLAHWHVTQSLNSLSTNLLQPPLEEPDHQAEHHT